MNWDENRFSVSLDNLYILVGTDSDQPNLNELLFPDLASFENVFLTIVKNGRIILSIVWEHLHELGTRN